MKREGKKGNTIYFLVLFSSVIAMTACSSEKGDSSENGVPGFVVMDIITKPTAIPENSQSLEKDAKKIEENIKKVEDSDLKLYGDQYVTEFSENNTKPLSMTERETNVLSPDSEEKISIAFVEYFQSLSATNMVDAVYANSATLSACFSSNEISTDVYLRMENNSFSEECTTPLEELRYIKVMHYGFDGEIYVGELVANVKIADDLVDIFKELFDAKYPVEHMVLIDDFEADDEVSMSANNTSAFNFRMADGTGKLSNHAYGLAIDINPLYNPYIYTVGKETRIVPKNGAQFIDRDLNSEYFIKKGDVCYEAFIKRGFTWGGDWPSDKDYQHFQKKFEDK